MPPLSKDLIILTVRDPSSLLSKAGLSESFISTGSKGRLGTVQEFIVPSTSQYLITGLEAEHTVTIMVTNPVRTWVVKEQRCKVYFTSPKERCCN